MYRDLQSGVDIISTEPMRICGVYLWTFLVVAMYRLNERGGRKTDKERSEEQSWCCGGCWGEYQYGSGAKFLFPRYPSAMYVYRSTAEDEELILGP